MDFLIRQQFALPAFAFLFDLSRFVTIIEYKLLVSYLNG
jgi:hypothetical protein